MNTNNLIFVCLIPLLFSSIKVNGQKYGYRPEELPQVLHDTIFTNETFSHIDKIYGFSGYNYSNFDFRHLSVDILKYQAFDNQTIWPESNMLPQNFRPLEWLETGKDPGLNIKQLHEEGITGKGISVAIFDKPINPEHKEIKDNIIYIPVHSDRTKDYQRNRIHFHGIACASILCGKTIGVSPDTKLYYFAVADDGNHSYSFCLALEKLFAVNDTLPENQRIRIVSISAPVSKKDMEIYSRWEKLEAEAKENNIAIIYSSFNSAHKYFTWGGCPPYKDNCIPDKYEYTPYVISADFNNYEEKIILPADFRTVADNKTNTTYNYSGESGFSWAIPYLAGLAALVLQINSDLTIEEIYNYIDKSKYITEDGKYVVNPGKLIELVKNE